MHRDLKPENIMMTRSGRVKIVDFGLAQPTGFQRPSDAPNGTDTQTQTDAGLRAGTVPYMSPEQARGAATDFRTDQFSFGLVLFEMATGHPPFRRDTRGRDARRDHQRRGSDGAVARRANAAAVPLDCRSLSSEERERAIRVDRRSSPRPRDASRSIQRGGRAAAASSGSRRARRCGGAACSVQPSSPRCSRVRSLLDVQPLTHGRQPATR